MACVEHQRFDDRPIWETLSAGDGLSLFPRPDPGLTMLLARDRRMAAEAPHAPVPERYHLSSALPPRVHSSDRAVDLCRITYVFGPAPREATCPNQPAELTD